MIVIKLNCSKIPKERLFAGKSGKLIDLVLIERPDQYDNDGFVSVSVTKAEREAGQRGEIVGNWKHIGQRPNAAPPAAKPAPKPAPRDPDLDPADDDSIPF